MSKQPRAAHTAKFYSEAPTQVDADGTRHWITRGGNFVVVATQAQAGAQLSRPAGAQSDEYFVLLPIGQAARVQAGAASESSEGDSLFIVPPGDSTVTVPAAGWVYRVFSKLAADVLALATNGASYADGAPDVAPLESWPEPVGGYALCHYPLADYVQEAHPMRLFRTRHLMINVFPQSPTPRDIRKMSPHSHADFEQGSLALSGGWLHHMRYPWGVDMTAWRADEHEGVSSPSLCIIPATAIHTSQSVGTGHMQLVDIFAPPRDDFSLKAGLVNNEADYPMPERLRDAAKLG
jgi:hypothetical protein